VTSATCCCGRRLIRRFDAVAAIFLRAVGGSGRSAVAGALADPQSAFRPVRRTHRRDGGLSCRMIPPRTLSAARRRAIAPCLGRRDTLRLSHLRISLSASTPFAGLRAARRPCSSAPSKPQVGLDAMRQNRQAATTFRSDQRPGQTLRGPGHRPKTRRRGFVRRFLAALHRKKPAPGAVSTPARPGGGLDPHRHHQGGEPAAAILSRRQPVHFAAGARRRGAIQRMIRPFNPGAARTLMWPWRKRQISG
jgi:hypothetical protein